MMDGGCQRERADNRKAEDGSPYKPIIFELLKRLKIAFVFLRCTNGLSFDYFLRAQFHVFSVLTHSF